MSRILVLTTDLPFFPGKMGIDFFNLRHLALTHKVSVLAPIYDWFPKEGVGNLERFLDKAYCWPRPVQPVPDFVAAVTGSRLTPWMARLPSRARWWTLRRLLQIMDRPDDAYNKLIVLSNCAPQLLHAITSSHFQALVLIQTSIEPWLDYLPAMGGKLVYFHDVRTHYLERAPAIPGQAATSRRELKAIHRQEQAVCDRADAVAFVSDLDCERAARLFRLRAEPGVAPIPVDTEYFTAAPVSWRRDPRPIVLFSGHLSHPPNVDAVLFFLREIWPRILAGNSSALFQAVGMMPAAVLESEIGRTPRCELHPNVPDIRPFFWNAMVYVVAMRYGGGVRQKIFEAWSMRVPVVCTTMAAEGTGARDQEHCQLADGSAAFAEQVLLLLEKGRDVEPMVRAARQYLDRNNSISAAAPRFQSLVEKTIRIRRRRPYKLLYDLRWMEIGKAGGIEQGAYELISAIAQLDRRNDFRVFAPRSTCCEWSLPSEFRIDMHYSDPPERAREALWSSFANRLSESLGLAPVLSAPMRSLAAYHRLDFDLVHSICGYTHPDLIGFPGILTINDLQHLHYPEFFSAEEYAEREKLYGESARRARHIICISEFTRQDVHLRYGIALEKMTTVWLIPSRNIWQEVSERKRRSLTAAMGLSGPFLFYPAHCWPHKNHAKLVEAFALVASDLPAELKFVLTGRAFPPEHPAAVLIREKRLGSRIIHLGFRSPLEIRALFQNCLALVFPSLFEGYGMPVVEAMHLGKPVLCSNVTSLPEIAGDAVLYFDPNDATDIARALLAVASQPSLRAALAQAAADRKPLFSARARAIETLTVYQRVYEEIYGD